MDYCEPGFRICLNVPVVNTSACHGNRLVTSKLELEGKLEHSPLLLAEKLQVISVATSILKHLHPHRTRHTSFLGTDPVCILQKMERKLIHDREDGVMSPMREAIFHGSMISAFNSISDFHTTYRPPAPLRTAIAFLPFLFKEFYEKVGNTTRMTRKFVVTDLATGGQLADPAFETGAEIVLWNGVPIEDAIRMPGESSFGNNEDSRLIHGIRRLTIRILAYQPVPLRSYQTVDFVDRSGEQRAIRVPWIYARKSDVVPNFTALGNLSNLSLQPKNEPVDPSQLFDHDADEYNFSETDHPELNAAKSGQPVEVFLTPENSSVSLNMAAKDISTTQGQISVITIHDFFAMSPTTFFREFQRLLLFDMPQTGVVIDIRGNYGGNLRLCQATVSLFTSKIIKLMTFSLRTTPVTLAPFKYWLVEERNLTAAQSEILKSALRAEKIGDSFFAKREMYAESINGYSGPRYSGPVVLLTDAATYSASEVLAATVKNNGAGILVGVHASTGGGGSSVISTPAISDWSASIKRFHLFICESA